MATNDQLMNESRTLVSKLNAGDQCTREAEECRRELLAAAERAQADEDHDAADRMIERAELIAATAKANAKPARTSNPNAKPGRVQTDPFADVPTDIDLSRAIRADQLMAAENLDTGGFDGFGDFLSTVRDQMVGRRFDERVSNLSGPQYGASGQNSSSNADGGVLIPMAYQAELLRSTFASQPWLERRRIFIVPDGSGDVVWPELDDRDQSGKDVGGAAMSRVAEGGEVPLATLNFRSQRHPLSKAGMRVSVTNELLADSAVGVEPMLNDIFGEAVAMRQALDFFNGTGVGEPMGILNSAGRYTTGVDGGQAANTILFANVADMFARLSSGSANDALWLYHPGAIQQLLQLALPAGSGGTPIWQFDAAAAPGRQILGRPAFSTEAAPLLGNEGDLVLADPTKYLYVVKPLRIAMSPHVDFANDKTQFRVILRDGGSPMFNSQRTGLNGYTSSEFVMLAVRD